LLAGGSYQVPVGMRRLHGIGSRTASSASRAPAFHAPPPDVLQPLAGGRGRRPRPHDFTGAPRHDRG
jgi:hypothetical protein